ncbi:NAD/NADP-dependent octopine/nopaline dehydrogenase family protein [Limoniibacter endophyticus]|uniref:Opine dehydrogenase n=1 Tax=Limoniibacter endophyticus TaxID=1565040 RepID=A0A8J3DJD0_9HYPH|nr:NAD/NADP-dependent octopine/nopaline dehydrogenase family protein [Limoniibacter endophyticus]GHC73057.1 opine dehydrogenase [Limoniibacter endophyticus]
MQVSILGAGSNAFGVAAFLANQGHAVKLWSPSGKRTELLGKGSPLKATGFFECELPVGVAASAQEAVEGADAVILNMPGNGHKAALDAAAPFLKDGQPVIISSHSSFGALYLSKLLAARGVRLPIIVWGTTLLTGRQKALDHVHIATVRQKIDVAAVPHSALDDAHALCTQLFGDRFVKRDGMMAIALSNLNPQNHLGIALLNLTRMEKGEEWSQPGHVTPAVGRLIEALDQERIAIAESFGLKVRTVFEHFSLSFHVPMGSVSEMNQAMYERDGGGNGPATIESRYILEDVPFGLLPTALLGRLVGKPALLHESGIEIFSASYGRDLKADNDLLPALGLEAMSLAELEKLCRNGYSA